MAQTDGIQPEQLTSFIDRIERLEEEMANIRSDIREIYAEAKGFGYDPKIMRAVLRLKKLDEIVGTMTEAKVAMIYDWSNCWGLNDAQGFQKNNKNILTKRGTYAIILALSKDSRFR